jgi:hypothetical protein
MMCFLAQQREDSSPCYSGPAAEWPVASTSAQPAADGPASSTSTQPAVDGPAATSSAQVDHDSGPTSQEGEMTGDLATTFQPELFCLSPQSPVSGSPLLPFDELKTPVSHPPSAHNILRVYSRRQPRGRAHLAAIPLEQVVVSTATDIPSQPCEEADNQQDSSRNGAGNDLQHDQIQEHTHPVMAENLGSSTAKKEFLNMVKRQVPTILPMPSFKEPANMVAPLVLHHVAAVE